MGGFHQGSTTEPLSSSATWFSQLCASARRFKSLAPPSSETAVRSSSGDSLVRRLGLFDLILLGVGASIGAGVFVVTGTVARDAGPGQLAWEHNFSKSIKLELLFFKINPKFTVVGVTISFLLAGASCVLNALCYAELASRFPAVVGGAYMYSYTAFNEITAFLVFVQLMLDYHIGAASISRSLASYAVALLELFPAVKDGSVPLWMGSGQEFFGGFLSLNVLAPLLLALLTFVLCQGVRESSAVNSVMTATKVVIVVVVICAGAFDIDVANWSPFAPNGFKAVLTGATVVFFSYVGFDAVANSAEESKNPQVCSALLCLYF